MHIRRCHPDDVAFAAQLAVDEGWRIHPQAYEDLMRLEPQGCFLAEDSGVPAGLVASITYGRLGWISKLIVRREYRRRGVGRALLHRAIGYLLDKGARTIGVDAPLGAIRFYECSGFHSAYEILHLKRGAQPAPPPIPDSLVPLQAHDLYTIAMFDWACFGGPRHEVLSGLLERSPVAFLSQDGGGVGGYLMARPSNQEWVIGPWVCMRSAEPLLTAALAAIGIEPVHIAIPKVNEHALSVLRAQEFRIYYREMRMYQGDLEHTGRPQYIYAIVSPEKG